MAVRALADLDVQDVDCTVHVRVLRKWNIKQRGSDQIGFVNMIVTDAQGSEMEVVIHKIVIPKFAPSIREGAIYKLGQFLVPRNTTAFRVTAPQFRIVLLPDSVCEEMEDSAAIPKFCFRFLKTRDLKEAFEHQDYLSDLVGELVQCDATQVISDNMVSIKKKDVQIRLIDSDEVVKVILWDSLVDQLDNVLTTEAETGAVVIFTSVYVHKYHGEYYFSTSCASNLYWNLHYPRAHSMLDFSSSGIPRKDGEICQSFIVPASVGLLEALNVGGPIKGLTYNIATEVTEVNAFWSDRQNSFITELLVKDDNDCCAFLFKSNGFRSISDSIFGTEHQFQRSSFDVNLKSLKGKTFPFLVKPVEHFYRPGALDLVVLKIMSG